MPVNDVLTAEFTDECILYRMVPSAFMRPDKVTGEYRPHAGLFVHSTRQAGEARWMSVFNEGELQKRKLTASDLCSEKFPRVLSLPYAKVRVIACTLYDVKDGEQKRSLFGRLWPHGDDPDLAECHGYIAGQTPRSIQDALLKMSIEVARHPKSAQ